MTHSAQLVTRDAAPVAEPVSGDRARWGALLELVAEWLAEHAGHSRTTYADAIGYPHHPVTGQPRDVSALRNGVAFLPWCAAAGVHPLTDVKRIHVLAWIEALGITPHPVTDKLLGKSTRAQMVSAVSSFFTWATQEGHVAANPVQVNRRKLKISTAGDTSPTRSLSRAEVAALQRAADTDRLQRQRLRSSAIIAVLFDVGLRVSELCTLTTADMGVMQGHRVLWLTLKGGRRHVVEMPAPVAERVDAYLASRSGLETRPVVRGQSGGSAAAPLFTTSTGKPLARSEVLRLVKRLAEAAGLDRPQEVHPHVARHSWITTARELGIEPSVIQEHVGHVDGKTTARYGKHALNVANSPARAVAAAYEQAAGATSPATV
jgi:integrase/recombinase XerD